jgi:carboxymethylenebutenolidase
MCFRLDSLPPVPVVSGAAVAHRALELESADGTRFAAFAAVSEQPAGAGVVVLPDVRGLYRFYEELALRFAEQGIAAVAIDYFGRTAGVGKRGDGFQYREHVAQTTPEGIQADIGAGVEYLRGPEGGSASRVFTVGFCFGGRHSWLAAAEGHDLSGAVGFYGRPGEGADGSPGPAQRALELDAPILGLMGGADESIPAEDVAAFGGRWRTPASSTSSSSTTGHPTASSTGATKSTPRRRRTPGGGCSSSSGNARDAAGPRVSRSRSGARPPAAASAAF